MLSPVKFISIVNMAITGIGAIVGIINARLLGPEAMGIVGVILGIYSTVTSFVDVRLMDVLARLYYQSEEVQYRGNVIRVFLIFSGLLSVLIWAIGFITATVFGKYFTNVAIKPEWVAYSSFYFALNYWVASVQYQQRFSERFYLIGTWKFVSYLAWVTVFLGILVRQPSVDGYFRASFWGAIVSASAAVGLSTYIWIRYQKFGIFSRNFTGVFGQYFGQVRLIFWGNILGYAKLLHRGSDILLVGYFADDRITGLYKVARSMADSALTFYDSMNQVYFPRFMQMLSKKEIPDFQKLARRALSAAGALTLVIIVVEWVGLKYFVEYVLTTKFQGAELAIVILSSTLFFLMGFHIWSMPIFIQSGRLMHFTGYSILAGLVQYLIVIIAFKTWIPSPALAALGYLGYYLFLTPCMLFLAYRINPEPLTGLFHETIFHKKVTNEFK